MYKHKAHEVDEICDEEPRKDDTNESENDEKEEKDEDEVCDNNTNEI